MKNSNQGFSAGIACCDKCHDAFVRRWPVVYLRHIEFQRSLISLDLFYSNSRLHLFYTRSEYELLVSRMQCPVCGATLSAESNIWPYNFPFEVPEFFEEKSDAIARLAYTTPFLVLTHPFAAEIFDAIKREGTGPIMQPLSQHYFRGRLAASLRTPQPTDFNRPPPRMTSEGRYNHAGSPTLNLATDVATCFEELGREGICAAEIQIDAPLKVLDISEAGSEHQAKGEVLSALVYSSLVSAPRSGDGWNQPQYVISRFVADCARYAGFDAIKYPTTRASAGHNLVVVNLALDLAAVGRVISILRFPHDSKLDKSAV